ncbi:MAG: dihydrodipicolinate reductase [Planctomycetota bacterium]|nr:MAG: dihydrodipicolinate reductase [Planctomycetota bacterium]
MRLAIVGYGRMGREVERLARRAGFEIVCIIKSRKELESRLDIVNAEVAVEFTEPAAAVGNLIHLAQAGLDIVCGTTGWYDRLDEVREVVSRCGVGVVYAPNFSVGAFLMFRIVEWLGQHLTRLKAEVGVFEAHHSGKKDAPSGTAKRIVETLKKSGLKVDESWLRVGGVVGWHFLLSDFGDETLELHHRVRSRAAFARGALLAAQLIRGRKGLFSFEQILQEFLNA